VVWLAPEVAHAERVVYINFDQTVLTNANEQDPTTNSFSSTGFTPGTISGWDLEDAQKAELMFWFREATVPFDFVFVDERPAAGSYDMLVFGDEADNAELFDLGCSASIGLADCEDTSQQNVSFMFYGCITAAQQADMKRVAFYGLTGLGFGWGLENLDASGQLMGSYTLAGLEFGDECTPIEGASQCTHVGCAALQQNSTSDLDARIGARVDDGPPVVTITSPPDQSVVNPNVTVQATVEDAFGGLEVELEIVEVGQTLADAMPPYEWDLVGIPDGTWTIRVTGTDADANVVMQEVVICVGVDQCGDVVGTESSSSGSAADESSSGATADDDGETGGDESSTGTPVGTTTDGTDDGNIDPTATPQTSGGFGGGSAASGCGCRSDAPSSTSVLLPLLFALRRRRPRAS
jgi:hypothetical protein